MKVKQCWTCTRMCYFMGCAPSRPSAMSLLMVTLAFSMVHTASVSPLQVSLESAD